MKLTLKQAHRLDKEIDTKIQQIFQKGPTRGHGRFTVSVHQDLNEFILANRAEIDTATKDTFALIQLRYSLRALIAQTKASCGLSELLTKEAGAKDLLGRLALLARLNQLTPSEEKIAAAKHSALATGKSTGDIYSSRDVVEIEGILSQSQADYFEDTIKTLKKDLVGYTDEAAAFNNSATLTLTQDAVDVLNKYKLL